MCLVQSIGATKSLVISPEPASLIRELTYSTELMGKQLLCLREVTDGLQVRIAASLYCTVPYYDVRAKKRL